MSNTSTVHRNPAPEWHKASEQDKGLLIGVRRRDFKRVNVRTLCANPMQIILVTIVCTYQHIPVTTAGESQKTMMDQICKRVS